MKIQIKSDKKLRSDIYFDRYGSLYFRVNDKLYQVNIDGRNNPYADRGDYSIIGNIVNDKIKYGKFKVEPVNLLQKKVDRELNSDEESDEEDEDEQDQLIIEEEVNEESDERIIYEELETKYGVHNKPFGFSYVDPSYEERIPVNNRNNGDVDALYDTCIYNNHSPCFQSYSLEEESIYKFRIFDNGEIYFKPMGYKEKKYELTYNSENSELVFIQL